VIRRFSHSETFNSVTRIRLVKTGNLSGCVTANCKLCTSAIALLCYKYELIVKGVTKPRL
jgi:hypothetical protein